MTYNKNIFLKILFIITTVTVMAYIYIMSSQVADESSKLSSDFLNAVLTFFSKKYNTLNYNEKLQFISLNQNFVRKLAHFSIYFVLGVSVFSECLCYSIKHKFSAIIGVSICLIYAVSDEFHQTFVLGRSGEIRDVLIDFTGSCLGIITVLLIISLYNWRKKSARKK